MILFNLSGHGHFDLASYERYLQGARGLRVPGREGREALAALRSRLTGAAGIDRCPGSPVVVRPPDLHRPPHPVRRGAALPRCGAFLTPSGASSTAPGVRRVNPPDDPGPRRHGRRIAQRRRRGAAPATRGGWRAERA